MANHEVKEYSDSLHVLMALSRTKYNQKAQCIRIVAKNYERDLAFLEAKVKLLGGKWRIHKTVNRRDTEKARKWLLKKLIDFPYGRGFVDSLWRTALLQRECIYGNKKFLFDVDTKRYPKLVLFEALLGEANQAYIERVETENGWHYITETFDTRKICELPYVQLIRDGYVYIKTVGETTEERKEKLSIISEYDNSKTVKVYPGKKRIAELEVQIEALREVFERIITGPFDEPATFENEMKQMKKYAYQAVKDIGG